MFTVSHHMQHNIEQSGGSIIMEEYFEITKSKIGDTVRFYIKGRISSSTSNKFTKELNNAISMRQSNIILDMRDVQFLSSMGIRAILSTYKQAVAIGGRLQIVNPPENVVNVLGMAALNTMLLVEK